MRPIYRTPPLPCVRRVWVRGEQWLSCSLLLYTHQNLPFRIGPIAWTPVLLLAAFLEKCWSKQFHNEGCTASGPQQYARQVWTRSDERLARKSKDRWTDRQTQNESRLIIVGVISDVHTHWHLSTCGDYYGKLLIWGGKRGGLRRSKRRENEEETAPSIAVWSGKLTETPDSQGPVCFHLATFCPLLMVVSPESPFTNGPLYNI